MSAQDPSAETIGRLEAALAADRLPASVAERGRRLLTKLRSPVRVSLFGLPWASQATILNLLAGRKVVPEAQLRTTLELVQGSEWSATVTLSDGTRQRVDGPSADAFPDDTVFLSLTAPLPALARVSLMAIASDDSPEELGAALRWGLRRTDIALWCTRGMIGLERALWRELPESALDHAFLVHTVDDAASVATARKLPDEGFLGRFPVATEVSRAALGKAGQRDEALWQASGAAALVAAVRAHADSGRMADRDAALVLLSRYGLEESDPGEASEETLPPVAAAAEIAGAPPPVEVAAAPVEQAVDAAPAARHALLPLEAERMTGALLYLRRRAAELLAETVVPTDDWPQVAMVHCVETVEYLTEFVADSEDDLHALERLREDLFALSDLVVLLQLEGGPEPATDAVTALLQVGRDLGFKLAA